MLFCHIIGSIEFDDSPPTHLCCKMVKMNEVTRILNAIEKGNQGASEQLLPMVYDELRKLAGQRMAKENPGQTLQATALVHEAYLRLLEGQPEKHWDSRGHFFTAAAEAMRRILVENARRKKRIKRGGEMNRVELGDDFLVCPEIHEDLVSLDIALNRLKSVDQQTVELVQLRYFVGLSIAEAAELLGISSRTADRVWAFARAWLHQEISGVDSNPEKDK